MENQKNKKQNKILLVSSDHSLGMIHFAASILNKLAESKEIDIYALLTTKGEYNYNDKLSKEVQQKTTFIECPQNKIINIIYKIIPFDIIWAIKEITKKHNIKKIHFITGDFRMWSFIWLFNYDYYYTVHDLTPHERITPNFSHRMLHKYMNWAYHFNTQHIKNLITCSLDQYKQLKNLYAKKNIKYVNFPSLINDKISKGRNKVPELSNIKNYILFFGGVDYYKGVDILVNAYQQIQQEITNPLVIAGKGLQFKGNNILDINRVIDDSELNDLFTKASVVVYPYRSITMSGVLSIAYYFKKNVIVSDLGFFLQNKSQHTFVFRSEDVKDLAKTLKEALEKPSDMWNAYDEIYSNKKMITDYLIFYNQSKNE